MYKKLFSITGIQSKKKSNKPISSISHPKTVSSNIPNNMYNIFVEHLEKESEDTAVSNTVLKHHNMINKRLRRYIKNIQTVKRSSLKKPSNYILNKLNLLYSIPDGVKINSDMLKGFATRTDNVNNAIEKSVDFIKNKLPSFNVNLYKTMFVNMHGSVRDYMFTVPENGIVVLLAPINRYIQVKMEYIKSIVEKITDINFVENYIRQPGCIPLENNCFANALIFYPGQRLFDMGLLKDTLSFNDYSGIIRAEVLNDYKSKITYKRGKNDGFIGLVEKYDYSKRLFLSNIINEKPAIYFVNSCRACNSKLDNYLIESIYYHEYMYKFINNYSRVDCSIKQDKQICIGIDIKNYIDIPEGFPKFKWMSPKKNTKYEDLLNNIYDTITNYRYDKQTFESRFIHLLLKLLDYNFFKVIRDINEYYTNNISITSKSHVLKPKISIYDYIVYNNYLPNNYNLMYEFIDEHLFNDDNIFIYRDDLIKLLNTDLKIPAKTVILCIFVLHIFYYYVLTNNITRVYELESIFTANNLLDIRIKDIVNTNINEKSIGNKITDILDLDYDFKFDYYLLLKDKIYSIIYDNNDDLIEKRIDEYYTNRAKFIVDTYLLNETNDDTDIVFRELLRHNTTFFSLIEFINNYINENNIVFKNNMMFYKLFMSGDEKWHGFTNKLFIEDNNTKSHADYIEMLELYKPGEIIDESMWVEYLFFLKIIPHVSGLNEDVKKAYMRHNLWFETKIKELY